MPQFVHVQTLFTLSKECLEGRSRDSVSGLKSSFKSEYNEMLKSLLSLSSPRASSHHCSFYPSFIKAAVPSLSAFQALLQNTDQFLSSSGRRAWLDRTTGPQCQVIAYEKHAKRILRQHLSPVLFHSSAHPKTLK